MENIGLYNMQTCNIEKNPFNIIFFLGLQGQVVLDQLFEKFAGSAQ